MPNCLSASGICDNTVQCNVFDGCIHQKNPIIHFSSTTAACKGGRNDVGRWDKVTCPDCLQSRPPMPPPSVVLRLSIEDAAMLCDALSVARDFAGVIVNDAASRLRAQQQRLAALRNRIDHAVIDAKSGK